MSSQREIIKKVSHEFLKMSKEQMEYVFEKTKNLPNVQESYLVATHIRKLNESSRARKN